jgi:hypothetical protein
MIVHKYLLRVCFEFVTFLFIDIAYIHKNNSENVCLLYDNMNTNLNRKSKSEYLSQ